MTAALAATFAARIVDWQRRHGRHDLPWQESRDPYRVWLSEVMLQQTQVTTVIPYYQRFLEVFPDCRTLAAAPLERVLELWSGLGYYSRARHLHQCARVVVERFAAEFPLDPEVLQTLPGIGRSTAAAIAVFAGARRAAILDGNVKRVLARAFAVDGPIGASATTRELWQLVSELLPTRDLEEYTQGLMDLGATLCTARAPRCASCPLVDGCVAHATQRERELPRRSPRRARPRRTATLALLHCRGEILVTRRAAEGIWGGLWSLPQSEGACDRDWAATLAARHGRINDGVQLIALVHEFTHFRLEASCYAFDLERSRDTGETAGEKGLWLDLADAGHAALPAPIKRLFADLYRHSPWHGHFKARRSP